MSAGEVYEPMADQVVGEEEMYASAVSFEEVGSEPAAYHRHHPRKHAAHGNAKAAWETLPLTGGPR